MYKLKPLKTIHNYFLALGTPVYLIENAAFFATGNTTVLPSVLAWDISVVVAYILVRLLYPVKYEVDNNGITVRDGKRLILKLKREQIEKVYISKGKWNGFLRWLYGMLAFLTVQPHCTSISFCFSESEICHQRICSIQRKRLMTSLDFKNELCEFNDFLTYRQCMKICKILGIEPIFVE